MCREEKGRLSNRRSAFVKVRKGFLIKVKSQFYRSDTSKRSQSLFMTTTLENLIFKGNFCFRFVFKPFSTSEKYSVNNIFFRENERTKDEVKNKYFGR